ncbi:MAG TPA: ATP-binding cassette domain-containing protein, partial [Caulobacteraceae bacterium]|nr:ATP-binding cassette domain-containing protein [Caulobacteraceae bacterium]
MASPRAPVIALKDVRLIDGPDMLFDGVDLALEPGVRACLVGRYGAGKSTLLRILAGRAEPDGGEGRRAALARAFAERPDVLLLDEPTNHL